MLSFLVDEDLPRPLAPRLEACGFAAIDVRDIGLRGASDGAIMEYAIQHELTVLTGDVGFANLLRFPLESHHGVVVARFANELSAPLVVDGITNLLIAI